MPTEEEFKSWLAHPVTQAFKRSLEARVSELQLEWVNGNFTAPEATSSMQLNARALGRAQAFAFVAEMEYADIVGGQA